MEPQMDPLEHVKALGARARSGKDWTDALLQGQAHVGFNTHWLMFSYGQTGAFFETKREELPTMLDQFEQDIADFERAAEALAWVARELLANGRRNAE